MHGKIFTSVNAQTFSEMEDTRRVQELSGQDSGIPELEHQASPVELQASRF